MGTNNGPKTSPHEIWVTNADSVKVTYENLPTSELVQTLNRGEALKGNRKEGKSF